MSLQKLCKFSDWLLKTVEGVDYTNFLEGTDGWMDGLMDGLMHGRTDGMTDRGFNIMPPDYRHGCIIKRRTTRICTTIHRYPIFSTRYSVMCKVYTGYCGTSEIEHGLCACSVDNPLAKAPDYLSVQAHKPCSISHLYNGTPTIIGA